MALPVRAGGKLDGMVLSDLYTSLKVRVLVCAVERNKEVSIPDGSFRLEGGDHIYVTSTVQSLLQLVKWTGMETQKIRSVMLIGGSRTAVYLARMLADAGIHVKLLETKPDRCERAQRRPAEDRGHQRGRHVHQRPSDRGHRGNGRGGAL